MGGGAIISITPANIITISICALLGYGLLVGANMAYQKLTGGSGMSGGGPQ